MCNIPAIYITNGMGTIKIEDVAVNNADGGNAMQIAFQNGAIILNRVQADHNINGGVFLDNTAGTAGITITNSSFDWNDQYEGPSLGALTISSRGAVLIDGITASHTTGVWPALYVVQSGRPDHQEQRFY